MRPFPLRLAALAVLLTAAAALVTRLAVAPEAAGFLARPALSDLTKWTYQLQNIDVDRLAAEDSDLAVIDHATAQGGKEGLRVLGKDEVARLKIKPDGSRRIVLAYLSIGEAETYRYYWQDQWRSAQPDWLWTENCRWPDNYLVRFWHDGWKDIIFRGDKSYLARILAAGFDGVYLDRIDVYSDLHGEQAKFRADMITFVRELADRARRAQPGFLVVAQNAEELLRDGTYRKAIDGIAKEDLVHGVKGTAKRNPQTMIEESLADLARLKADGKAVLAVEYLTSADARSRTREELKAHDIVATFPPRALDGSDPDQAKSGAGAAGTPEYAASNCDGVFHKSER